MGEYVNATGRRRPWAPAAAMLAALAAWLWPIGVGGRMPVGGDVTQFQLGLMAVLARAIRAGRLPLWNDLWGYGFPGVAESQMGAFYPPHWLLYGALPLTVAFTASLVLHTAWGALGAMWAARRFGVSPWGAALAGFAWGASGFNLIHLVHTWGYTAGSWLPWAWGLGWTILRGERPWRGAWWLAGVLAIQATVGHFQLAFITQAGLAGMILWGLVERPDGVRPAWRGALATAAALAATLPLAAIQLAPSARLARLAAVQRDYIYLSGFAATPIHLVSYVAPRLLHGSPLWRPVAWDPFHTSPEEHLAYVGLVPLFLAIGAILRGFRADPGARLLAGLAVGTLLLSLGPYCPGFSKLILLPGFSFFRSAARWSLGTSLALAILAGKGFDALPAWPRPGRSLGRFVGLAVAAPLVLILGFELGLASTEGAGWPAVASANGKGLPPGREPRSPVPSGWARVASAMGRAMQLLPFMDGTAFGTIMADARAPQSDLRVLTGLANEGYDPVPPAARLDRERFGIYWREWRETGVIVLGLLALIPFARRGRPAQVALLGLTVADLCLLGRHRGLDEAPIRPLTAQSPVLARLAAEPRGTRLVDPIRNLPMTVGVAPVTYYRTMDLPAVPGLARLAAGPLGRPDADARAAEALRATGARYRLLDPYESATLERGGALGDLGGTIERIDDPALATWMFNAAWARSRAARSTFLLWRPASEGSRAWLVPGSADLGDANPAHVLDLLRRADPLTWKGPDPEHLEVDVPGGRPGWVVLSVLHDPEWLASWADGRPAEIVAAFGGWMAVRAPATGGTVRFGYRGRDVRLGLGISAVSWLVMLGLGVSLGRAKGLDVPSPSAW